MILILREFLGAKLLHELVRLVFIQSHFYYILKFLVQQIEQIIDMVYGFVKSFTYTFFYLYCRLLQLKEHCCVLWQTFVPFILFLVCFSRSFLSYLLLRSYGQLDSGRSTKKQSPIYPPLPQRIYDIKFCSRIFVTKKLLDVWRSRTK